MAVARLPGQVLWAAADGPDQTSGSSVEAVDDSSG